MKKLILITLASLALSLSSCNELLQIANTMGNPDIPVSEAENAAGLKSSLDVGIENAVNILGIENGFMNDVLVKILLPAEAKPIIDNIRLIPGGEELVNRAILSLNRTAEDAVKEATPIFKHAITSITFKDAAGILFGGDYAATSYLKEKTSADLLAAFAPKVKNSLGKPLVANLSTTQSWNALTSAFNKVAASPVGIYGGMKPVNVNLEEYVTQKALDALFLKVGEEEKKIRENPVARITAILKRVFGQLDKK
ncbi:MAG TPA: DUF4197 domain-containing protein [Paludibacteraceae bacterium]|nr:DUF4197 domain-containing protein [Paludibacteraceae bacterium]